MAVSSTTSKVSYTATASQTTFAYTFKIFADGDLNVYVNDVLKTLTTDYTVTGAGDASGGNVVFVSGLSASDEVVIERVLDLTQGTDYVENDPFPAETHEDALDRLTFIAQQHQDALDRTVKFATTVTDAGDVEVLGSATARASKLFAFDSAGDLDITQEIGAYQGNWGSSTVYVQRDIVKDTSNNNIYICVEAHTSSGSQPISTNTDSAKWALIVDAASATTSASAAATSATAAATSATAAASSASAASTSETNAATSATSASTAQTAAETAQTAAETAQAAAEAAEAAAETYADNFDDAYLGAKASDPTVDNDGDALADGALYFDTTNNVMKVYDLGSTTWYQLTPTVSNQTNINTVAGIASDVSTVAGISSDVTTVSGISGNTTTVAGISSNVTTVAGISANVTTVAGDSTNINTVAGISANVTTVAGISSDVTTAATNVADITNFADVYIGASASDPTTRADSSALQAGDLYFNTSSNVMKYYTGSAWGTITVETFTEVSQDTTPQLGGDLDTNGNAITGSTVAINASNGEFMISATENGPVALRYDNNLKLSTKSDGVNITGELEADSLDIDGDGDISGNLTIGGDLDINGTGALKLPVGTTAQQPASPTAGDLRWNSDDTSAEIYDGSAWGSVGGGGAATTVYAEHAHTLSENLSIASGNNAVSGGPITINSGYSVTVPSGSVWTIV